MRMCSVAARCGARPRRAASPLLGTLLAAAFHASLCVPAHAQPNLPTAIAQTKFNSGQDVVPSFDGWIHNADGTFTFVFGYLNRNYKQELAIPAGADNKLETGPVDQGQPTYFLPRRHAFVFKVTVPADWGKKELVWSITANGQTEKAYASLQLEEEIIPRVIMSHGGLSPGLEDPNQPPVVSIAAVSGARTGVPVSITALVSDDGLPKPRLPKARVEAAPGKAQSNSAGGGRRTGLSVTWFEYCGPAKVSFDPPEAIRVGTPGQPISNGPAQVLANFAEPGTYVLRATADDGGLATTADVTITVTR